MESSRALWHPAGKAVPSALARSWAGTVVGSQGTAAAVGQEGGPRCSGSRTQGSSAPPWGALGPSLDWGVTLGLPPQWLREGWGACGEVAACRPQQDIY